MRETERWGDEDVFPNPVPKPAKSSNYYIVQLVLYIRN